MVGPTEIKGRNYGLRERSPRAVTVGYADFMGGNENVGNYEKGI